MIETNQNEIEDARAKMFYHYDMAKEWSHKLSILENESPILGKDSKNNSELKEIEG